MTASEKSVFHSGERLVQERYGVREKIESIGRRVIRDFMPDQHRLFYAEQPFLVLGSLDKQGRPWASMICGDPGFVSSPDPVSLQIDAQPLVGDPLRDNLKVGAPLGLLGIQLHTRRRNRVNGSVTDLAGGIHFKVDLSFGNCPKFIQARAWEARERSNAAIVERHSALDEEARIQLAKADTFFIASACVGVDDTLSLDTAQGVDVSHRGGRPGFVSVREHGFSFPDYSGNFLFNTVGNLVENPASGYLFPDFESGDLLLLSGRTEVVWEPGDQPFPPGAERVLKFELDEMVRLRDALPFRWTYLEESPFLARLG